MRPVPDYFLADNSQKLCQISIYKGNSWEGETNAKSLHSPIQEVVNPSARAGDEIRTHDIHVGNVTLYHWATPA